MWASLTEANGYLADTVGGEAWAALSADSAGRYLTTAFRILSRDKDYSFPDVVSDEMAEANIEFAFWLLTNSGQQAADLIAQGVSEFKIGTFMMKFRNDSEVGGQRASYPKIVMDLLDQYLMVGPAVAEVTAREL